MADIETLAADTRYYGETTAPGTPSAGEAVTYVKSSDKKLYLKDSTGTETDLTSGGGGAVATDTIWDAKGDLAGGTGADTAAKLTVGANDTVLTADSAEATGMKWAAVSGASFSGALVYNNGVQSVTTGVDTALTFDSEDHDTDTIHSTVSNTSRLTVPSGKAGYWRIWANVYLATASTNGRRELFFKKNGTTDLGTRAQVQMENVATETVTIHLAKTVLLAVSDYIEAYVYHADGVSNNYGHASARAVQCEFGMDFVGS